MPTAQRYERARKYDDAWATYSKILSRAPGTETAKEAMSLIERLKKRRDEDFAFMQKMLADGGEGPAKLALNKHVRVWGDHAVAGAAGPANASTEYVNGVVNSAERSQ